jgi:hypothetical protein
MSLSFMSFLPSVDRSSKNVRAVCDFSGCHNKQFLRSIPGSRPGIQVGSLWFCSVDCFAFAARIPLANLSNRRSFENPRSPRLSLGLALLSKRYLTAADLRAAMVPSPADEEELATTLIRLGVATEKQIATARSAQWGYPVFAQDFAGAVVQLDIPKSLLQACSAAPLHYSATAKRILMGFVSRVEHNVLEAIEQMTGCRVEPCFITPSDCEERTEQITVSSDYEEVVVDDPGPPEKMARTVGRLAVDIGARDASFAHCKNNVWVRIAGKRGKVDVIFRLNRAIAEFRVQKTENFSETQAILG